MAVGYNGMPYGCDDDQYPWDREGGALDSKYMFVCHAELNAILNFNGGSMRGFRLYTTLFPCNECAKAIIQKGIAEVIYLSDKYATTPGTVASKRMLRSAGIALRRLETERASLVLPLSSEK